MIEVVAFGFQGVEAFVLDLPARPAASCQFDHGVAIDGQIGDEAVAIGHLVGGVAYLDHQPIDRHGVGAVAQRHVAYPTIGMGESLPAVLDPLCQFRKFDPGQVFLDGRMGRRLADEQEMPARRPHRLADRLAGVEVVAQIDGIKPCVAWAMGGEPA